MAGTELVKVIALGVVVKWMVGTKGFEGNCKNFPFYSEKLHSTTFRVDKTGSKSEEATTTVNQKDDIGLVQGGRSGVKPLDAAYN